jgi:hypothetical protein
MADQEGPGRPERTGGDVTSRITREIDDAIDALPAEPERLTLSHLERLSAAMRDVRERLAELRYDDEHADAVQEVLDLIDGQRRLSRWLDAGVGYWSRHDKRRWHHQSRADRRPS